MTLAFLSDERIKNGITPVKRKGRFPQKAGKPNLSLTLCSCSRAPSPRRSLTEPLRTTAQPHHRSRQRRRRRRRCSGHRSCRRTRTKEGARPDARRVPSAEQDLVLAKCPRRCGKRRVGRAIPSVRLLPLSLYLSSLSVYCINCMLYSNQPLTALFAVTQTSSTYVRSRARPRSRSWNIRTKDRARSLARR